MPKAEKPPDLRQGVNHVSGLICKASPQYTQELRPSRPQGVTPGFRASLVQPSASLRPFHSRYRFVPRVGDPPPLAVATPRLRQEAFGMYARATAPI
jgi:hypothetical protein